MPIYAVHKLGALCRAPCIHARLRRLAVSEATETLVRNAGQNAKRGEKIERKPVIWGINEAYLLIIQ